MYCIQKCHAAIRYQLTPLKIQIVIVYNHSRKICALNATKDYKTSLNRFDISNVD